MLVEERARVFFGGEVAALPAPVGPGAGEAIEDLAGIGLAAEAFFFWEIGERRFIGDRTPQPRGDLRLFEFLQARRDAGLAEILLRQNVGGDWLKCSGTSKPSRRKTMEPSGFLISEVARRNGIFA